jgi:transcriptional regulator with XRE-family HTH domain
MDDRRVGATVRSLRRRRHWRQRDLAETADVSQSLVSLIERGHVDALSLRSLRRILAAVDARADLDVRWRGGGLDRLLDERHARLVGAMVRELASSGWSTGVEVTYARYGERGSIDILALHRDLNALLVVEVKSEITSLEETLRRLDEKVRLGPSIAAERYRWQASCTSRLLVLPETTTSRDRIARHGAVLDAVFPVRGIALRTWLAEPRGLCSGIRLLRLSNPGGHTRSPGGAQRVRARP